MKPIPKKIRDKLSQDPRMKTCIHNNSECSRKIEWEHAWTYRGRQIQEEWAIIPVCYMHHRGGKLDKRLNEYMSLKKAKRLGVWQDILKEYPKKDWEKKWKSLNHKYK